MLPETSSPVAASLTVPVTEPAPSSLIVTLTCSPGFGL